MTRDRNFGEDEPFEKWLRAEEQLSSKAGYVRSDLDIVWRNYKARKFMLLEKKTHGKTTIASAQKDTYALIHEACLKAHHEIGIKVNSYFNRPEQTYQYCGFHTICFENEGPEDGKIYLAHRGGITKDLTLDMLIKFMRFGAHQAIYDIGLEREI